MFDFNESCICSFLKLSVVDDFQLFIYDYYVKCGVDYEDDKFNGI